MLLTRASPPNIRRRTDLVWHDRGVGHRGRRISNSTEMTPFCLTAASALSEVRVTSSAIKFAKKWRCALGPTQKQASTFCGKLRLDFSAKRSSLRETSLKKRRTDHAPAPRTTAGAAFRAFPFVKRFNQQHSSR